MKSVGIFSLVLSILFTSACSVSPKTQVVQMGDSQLSKAQIMAELNKLDKAESEVNSKKGVNGTNVASFLFWLPGLAYTYYDAGEAQRLIEQRRSHLTALYNQKYANKDETLKARG